MQRFNRLIFRALRHVRLILAVLIIWGAGTVLWISTRPFKPCYRDQPQLVNRDGEWGSLGASAENLTRSKGCALAESILAKSFSFAPVSTSWFSGGNVRCPNSRAARSFDIQKGVYIRPFLESLGLCLASRYDKFEEGGGGVSKQWMGGAAQWLSHRVALHSTAVEQISRHKNPNYRQFAQSFSNGSFSKAVAALSEYIEPEEPLPSFLALQHAVVHENGQVQSCKLFLNGKGCSVPELAGCKTELPAVCNRESMLGGVVVLATPWAHGYFHWMLESLVRLPVVWDLVEDDPHVAVHVIQPNAFVRSALDIFGVPPHRVVSGLRCARTVLYPEPAACGNPSGPLLRLFHAELAARLALSSAPWSKNAQGSGEEACRVVVVVREGMRAVRNNAALVGALRAGLPGCAVEEHRGGGAVASQLAAFNAASAVVAPHGAGLSNLIACRPGTAVVELLTEAPNTNLCYCTLALKLGLRYAGMVPLGSSHAGGMTVDVPEVVGLLTGAMAAA